MGQFHSENPQPTIVGVFDMSSRVRRKLHGFPRRKPTTRTVVSHAQTIKIPSLINVAQSMKTAILWHYEYVPRDR